MEIKWLPSVFAKRENSSVKRLTRILGKWRCYSPLLCPYPIPTMHCRYLIPANEAQRREHEGTNVSFLPKHHPGQRFQYRYNPDAMAGRNRSWCSGYITSDQSHSHRDQRRDPLGSDQLAHPTIVSLLLSASSLVHTDAVIYIFFSTRSC